MEKGLGRMYVDELIILDVKDFHLCVFSKFKLFFSVAAHFLLLK